MAGSFFFYDLETSGLDPRQSRIMQFAGQRTDEDLNPIGEPVNVLVKLAPDTLPSPDAILVTGITPQQTIADGLTEAEFLKLFYDEVVQPNTTFLGFNSIRFDDEFMRFLHWRNFYDAYEWQWLDGCSRWDLLDVVRMTRALRPDGIEWPFAPNGKPANRLELLTAVNGLSHEHAHDALSDVHATIAVAKLIRDKQPDLFNWLFKTRKKKDVSALMEQGQPFVYSCGKYSSDNLNTTVAIKLAKHTQRDEYLVYDLRHDPTPFLQMNVDELVAAWRYSKDPDAVRLPVKTLKCNHCPAIAPLGVAKDAATQERIGLTLATVTKHLNILKDNQAAFVEKLTEAVKQMDAEREARQITLVDDENTVDSRLYDGFIEAGDKSIMRAVRAAAPEALTELGQDFSDDRLKSLMPLYKARNYPRTLTDEERAEWEAFCRRQLFEGGNSSRLAKYFERLAELAEGESKGERQFLLEELQLYGQSIIPADVTE
jgi:exodeoxyribonuclease I